MYQQGSDNPILGVSPQPRKSSSQRACANFLRPKMARLCLCAMVLVLARSDTSQTQDQGAEAKVAAGLFRAIYVLSPVQEGGVFADRRKLMLDRLSFLSPKLPVHIMGVCALVCAAILPRVQSNSRWQLMIVFFCCFLRPLPSDPPQSTRPAARRAQRQCNTLRHSQDEACVGAPRQFGRL